MKFPSHRGVISGRIHIYFRGLKGGKSSSSNAVQEDPGEGRALSHTALVCFPGRAKETTDPLLPSQAFVHDRTRDIFGLEISFLASLGSSEEAKKETGHISWGGGVSFFPP